MAKAKGKGNLVTFQVDRNDIHKGIFRAKMTSVLQTLKSRRAAAVENEDSKNKNQTNLLLKILSFLQNGNHNKTIEEMASKMTKPIVTNQEESPENSPNLALVKQEIKKELQKKISYSEQARQDYSGRRRRTKKVVFDPIDQDQDWFYEKSIVNKLTPHGIFLRIPANQTNLYYTYKRQLMAKNYREMKVIFVFFFIIYNIKTFVLISLRTLFGNELFFLIYRGGFCLVMILTVLSAHQFAKNKSELFKKNCSRLVMACYFYGFSTILLEIQNADIKEDFLVSYLELIIIILVYTNIS